MRSLSFSFIVLRGDFVPIDVSIIIPVYNCEQYIEKCVQSLILQTKENIEIILVNDGSTDKSLSICNNFAQRYSQIHVLSQCNGGASKARSFGIAKAVGKYVAFLDADDWAHPDMIKVLYQLAEENTADIVQCSFIKTQNRSDDSITISDKPFQGITGSREALSQLLCTSKEKHFNFLLWNKLFKRELFSHFDYPVHIKQINDVPVVPRAFYYAKKIMYTEQQLIYYFERNDGDHPSTMDLLYKSRERFIYTHLEAFSDVEHFFAEKDNLLFLQSCFLTVSWMISAMKIKNLSDDSVQLIGATSARIKVFGNNFIPLVTKTKWLLVNLLYHSRVFLRRDPYDQ